MGLSWQQGPLSPSRCGGAWASEEPGSPIARIPYGPDRDLDGPAATGTQP